MNIYLDGACSSNGSLDAKAGIGIYFGKNDKRNLSEQLYLKNFKNVDKLTNNIAELYVFIRLYEIIKTIIEDGSIINIYSDSEYAIKCLKSYGDKVSKKNFMKKEGVEIPNRLLVKEAYELYKNKLNINIHHCKAHTNNTDEHSVGNSNADRLANQAIELLSCPYNKETEITNDEKEINIEFDCSVYDNKIFNNGKYKNNTYKSIRINHPEYFMFLVNQPSGNVYEYYDFIKYCIYYLTIELE